MNTHVKVPNKILGNQIYQLKKDYGTSLVVQWIRICLPMQGIQVRSLVLEKVPQAAEQPSTTTTEKVP